MSLLTVLSVLLSLTAFAIYFRAIIRREALVSLGASGLFWTNTFLGALNTQFDSGSGFSIAGLWVFAILNLGTVLLALSLKQYAPLKKIDAIFLAVAIGLFGFQKILTDPQHGIFIAMGVELLGNLWIISKMQRHPNKEPLTSWTISILAFGLTAMSAYLEHGSGSSAYWFPLFVFANTLIVLVYAVYQKLFETQNKKENKEKIFANA